MVLGSDLGCFCFLIVGKPFTTGSLFTSVSYPGRALANDYGNRGSPWCYTSTGYLNIITQSALPLGKPMRACAQFLLYQPPRTR